MNFSQRIDPSQSALVIVDVQNDYCHKDGFLANQGNDVTMVDQMLPSLKNLIGQARENNVPIIFVRTIHEESTDSDTWTSRMKSSNTKNQGLCRQGTWGSEFYQLEPQPDDIIVTKHRYSAFIHTRLESVLRTLKTKTLIMAGVSTNVCVESTARDGFMLDYDVVFLSDCTAAYSKQAHDMTLSNISTYFGSVNTSNQVSDTWNKKVLKVK